MMSNEFNNSTTTENDTVFESTQMASKFEVRIH